MTKTKSGRKAAELNRTGLIWLLLEEPSGKNYQVLAELLVTLAEIKKYELVGMFSVDMKSQTKRVMLDRMRATGLPSQDASKCLVPMQFEGRSCLPVSSPIAWLLRSLVFSLQGENPT